MSDSPEKMVHVTGFGFNSDIEIQDGQTLTSALKSAGVNCAAGNLTIKVGGTDYVEGENEPDNGARVTATPAKVSHGA